LTATETAGIMSSVPERGFARVDGKEARLLEKRYLRGVLDNLHALGEIPDPLSGRVLEVEYDPEALMTGNHRGRIRQRMADLGVFDKERLAGIPLEGYVRYEAVQRGLLGVVGRVIVHAACVCPADAFLKKGEATEPVGRLTVEDLFLRVVTRPEVFHYVGLFSPTGFSEEACENLPVRNGAELVLVEKKESTRWTLHYATPKLRPAFMSLFDAESRLEKTQRFYHALKEEADLQYGGGFVLLEEMMEREGVSRSEAEAAIRRLLSEDDEIGLEEVDGKAILKRRLV